MNPSRLPLLTIAILVLLLQQTIPSLPPALALRGLNDTRQTRNASAPIAPNTTTYLPDPSHCDPPLDMGTFFFANSTSEEQQLRGADAEMQQPQLLTSNSSEKQNSTSAATLNGNFSGCSNASSTTEHKGPQSHMPNMHVDARAVAHVEEDAPLYEVASMRVVAEGNDDVLLVNEEGGASKSLHITDPSSVAEDSVRVMVINDEDDVVVVDAEQRNITTKAPVDHVGAPPATSESSVAKDNSVQFMEVNKDVLFFDDAEQLGGRTPPPGSGSIHTAAGSSIARESVQVIDLTEGGMFWIKEEQLASSTPPPSDTTIHTAAQSSVARESVQVMVIDEGDVVLAKAERLGRATPPPIDTSIHMAGQRSAAREPMQVMEMIEGVNAEQLGVSTPPPGDTDIHTASQSSVARDSRFHVSLQDDEAQHDHILRQ